MVLMIVWWSAMVSLLALLAGWWENDKNETPSHPLLGLLSSTDPETGGYLNIISSLYEYLCKLDWIAVSLRGRVFPQRWLIIASRHPSIHPTNAHKPKTIIKFSWALVGIFVVWKGRPGIPFPTKNFSLIIIITTLPLQHAKYFYLARFDRQMHKEILTLKLHVYH